MSWRHAEQLLLMRAVSGHLSEAERLELDIHLSTCERCDQHHKLLSRTAELATSQPVPPLRNPARLRAAALQGFQPTESAPTPRRARPLLWATLAVAGVIAAVVALSIFSARGDQYMSRPAAESVADVPRDEPEPALRPVFPERLPSPAVVENPSAPAMPRTITTQRDERVTVELDRDSAVEIAPTTKVTLNGNHVHLKYGRTVFSTARSSGILSVARYGPFELEPDTRIDVQFDGQTGVVRVVQGSVRTAGHARQTDVWTEGEQIQLPSESHTHRANRDSARNDGSSADTDAPMRPAKKQASRRATKRARSATQGSKSNARPSSSDSPESAVAAAEVLILQRRYPRAIKLLLGTANRHPRTSAGEEALFLAGDLMWRKLRQSTRARATLERYRSRYPRGRFRTEAKKLLGEITRTQP